MSVVTKKSEVVKHANRLTLRQEYIDETKEMAFVGKRMEPTLDYVKWLEDKIVNN